MQHRALIFTDIVDSTALNARLGDDKMQALWDWHDEQSRLLLQRFNGRETARSDGLVAVFETADAAAGFAVEYQRTLTAHAEGLHARVGLHWGPVALRANDAEALAVGAATLDATGLSKAICARLMGLAPAGQVLASQAFICGLTPSAVEPRSHGFFRFKGLNEPVGVYELAVDGRFGSPPTDVEKAHRVTLRDGAWSAVGLEAVHLPPEPNRFHGRQHDLQVIAERIDRGSRLVSVVGTGGIGKTRLALRYAWAWAGAFEGGVYFCDLSSAADADGVVAAVARAMTVPLGADPTTQLGHALAGRGKCLLLLDNAEQVIAPVRHAVARWMQLAPGAIFLITSRERLGLAGEHSIVVDPLSVEEAAQLFLDRAAAVRSNAVTEESDPIRELVQRLDCLPLAIELAAARVSAFGPRVLLERLGQRFSLLSKRAGRDAGDRQATLWAALDWSWRLLGDEERRVLAQASIFAGSFGLDAAEAVLGAEPTAGSGAVLDALDSLCEKSLVRPLHGDRFALLQGVRDFAAHHLRSAHFAGPSAEALSDAVRSRHVRHFGSLTEEQVRDAGGIDLDNLIAACRNATGEDELTHAVSCLELAWSLLRRSGPFAAAIELARGLGRLVASDRDVARVCWVQASASFAARDTADARASVDAGLNALRPTSDPDLRAKLYALRGEVLSIQGEFAQAARDLDAAWASALLAQDRTLVCTVLNARGALAADQGDVAHSRQRYEELLREAERLADDRWQACALGNLAVLLMEAGDFASAAQQAQRSLALSRQCGERRWMGNAHCNIGLILQETGQLQDARHHLEEARTIACELGHRALEVTTDANLGLLAEREGDLQGACILHRRAVAGAQSLNDERLEGQLRACLISALARAGQLAEAKSGVARSLEVFRNCDLITRGLIDCGLAELYEASGELVLADAHAISALNHQQLAGVSIDSELGRRVVATQALRDRRGSPRV